MRRCLILLLLFVLPLQFTWAAASSYCQHETSPATSHTGHHEHQHPNEKNSDDIKSTPLLGDSDCGYCHLCAAQLTQIHAPVLPALVTSATPEGHILPLQTRDPDRLERPNWRHA